MGFMDEVSNGGSAPILKFNKEGRYAKAGSDKSYSDQEFVVDVHATRGGYIKFNGKELPEKRLGSIFPKDEAPLRAALGDTDEAKWAASKFNKGEVRGPMDGGDRDPAAPKGNRRGVSLLRSSQNVTRCCARLSHAGPTVAADSTPSSASASAPSSLSSDQSRSRC